MAQHNELGKKGEQLAIDYLVKKGYKILDKNWRYLKAEVDIIAKKDSMIVAVEVKTRSSDYFGDPQDFINKKKISLKKKFLKRVVTDEEALITPRTTKIKKVGEGTISFSGQSIAQLHAALDDVASMQATQSQTLSLIEESQNES